MDEQQEISVIISSLRATDSNSQYIIYRNLVSGDKTFAVKTLVAIIRLEDLDTDIRRWAAYWLGTLSDLSAVEPLIDILKDNEASLQTKIHAIYALGGLKARQAVDILLYNLKNEDESLRTASAAALSEIQDKRALEPLIDLFNSSVGAERNNLIYDLADFDDPQVLHILLNVMNSCVDDVYFNIIQSLGNFTDPLAYEKLILFASDKNVNARSAAIKGLGSYGSLNALPLLQELAETDNEKDSEGDRINKLALESISEIMAVNKEN